MTGKRRRRRICNGILTAVTAISLWGLMVTGIFRTAVYRMEIINQVISETGYEQKRWEAFRAEAGDAVRDAGLPEEILDWERIRDRFLVELKQELRGSKEEESGGWLSSMAAERVRAFLDEQEIHMTEEAERGVAALGENLQAMEERYTSVPEIENWKKREKAFQEQEKAAMMLLGGILLLAMGTAAGIQHRKSRILDIAGIGGLAGSVLTAASVMTAWWLSKGETEGPAGLLKVQAVETGLLFAAAGAAVSVCLWTIGKFCRGVRR